MDYNMDSKDNKRADAQVSAETSGVSQDGKAYKLINLNYDIVIIVRTARSYSCCYPACFDKLHPG
jgi:hypothetical protein